MTSLRRRWWRFSSAERFQLRLLLLAVALVLVALPFAFLVFAIRHVGPIGRLDLRVANAMHDAVRDSPFWVRSLKVVSFFGSATWLWIFIGSAVLYCVWRDRFRLALFLGLTCALGGLLDSVLKGVIGRTRPVFPDAIAHAPGKSFPSGHSMGSIIGYGALAVVFLPAVQRRWRPWVVGALGTLVALIGFSRIGLGVHYLTDVIGGFVLGAAWLTASVAAFEVWRVERGRRPVEHPLTEGVEPEAGKDLKPDLANTGEKERA